MMVLLQKDFKDTLWVLIPSFFFALSLVLLQLFASDLTLISEKSIWFVIFVSSAPLFYRSFSLENRNRSFLIYTQFKVSRLQLFLSQSLSQAIRLLILSHAILSIYFLFFTKSPWSLSFSFIAIAVSFCLAPIGTLLGLTLQIDREFLFSLIYFPLSTPVFLAALALSEPHWNSAWINFILAYFLITAFASAFIFEFFFDDLSQNS